MSGDARPNLLGYTSTDGHQLDFLMMSKLNGAKSRASSRLGFQLGNRDLSIVTFDYREMEDAGLYLFATFKLLQ